MTINQVPERHRGTAERLIRDVCRLKDVRAQLFLHRSLKQWLVLHLACAAALGVFLLVHIVTMLRVKYGYTQEQAREEIRRFWAEYEAKNKVRKKADELGKS